MNNHIIQRVNSSGQVSNLVNQKPLYAASTCISKTQSNDVLVSLSNDEDHVLLPPSRRLVQRMTMTLKVFRTFEFQEDGTTSLFNFPGRAADNCNTDICVVNLTDDNKGELVILREDGRVNATYHGHEDSQFDPSDVAFDSKGRILIVDFKNKRIHLLS